jgi:acyl dehydratase/sugar lactone lactonase YvrE
LLVTDQQYGLRLVEPDGTSKPFGDLTAAGYSHHPPAHSGGANGLSLEPDGTHVLLADVFGAAIYRVDVATRCEREGLPAPLRHQQCRARFPGRDLVHPRARTNTPEDGEARMWANVDRPGPRGSAASPASENGRLAPEAVVVVDSLYFGNGLAIDERSGHLYLAETSAARVWRFRVDLATGALTERSVFVDSVGADNLELDDAGNLWIASPLTSEILVVNTSTGERHSAFSTETPEQAKIVAEFNRRGQAGEPRMNLFTPAVWAPLPGLITGVIVGPGRGPVYLTGLGNAPAPPSTLRPRMATLAELRNRIGEERVSDWRVITQEMVDGHAALTGDADPFHNDVEWSRANTPWHGTIVQGFLLLGHFTWFLRHAGQAPLDDVEMIMNYGFNRIRFVRPVLTGTPIRARITLLEVDDRGSRAGHPLRHLYRKRSPVWTARGRRMAGIGAEEAASRRSASGRLRNEDEIAGGKRRRTGRLSYPE